MKISTIFLKSVYFSASYHIWIQKNRQDTLLWTRTCIAWIIVLKCWERENFPKNALNLLTLLKQYPAVLSSRGICGTDFTSKQWFSTQNEEECCSKFPACYTSRTLLRTPQSLLVCLQQMYNAKWSIKSLAKFCGRQYSRGWTGRDEEWTSKAKIAKKTSTWQMAEGRREETIQEKENKGIAKIWIPMNYKREICLGHHNN